MRGREVEFEEYGSPETRTEKGIACAPDGGEGGGSRTPKRNLLGVVRALPG
jgi:hypothetical protein